MSPGCVVGHANRCLFLGSIQDNHVRFNEQMKLEIGEPVHLTRLDARRFCVLSQTYDTGGLKTLQCFDLSASAFPSVTANEKVPTISAFRELSRVSLGSPLNTSISRLVTTSHESCFFLSTLTLPLELFSLSSDGTIEAVPFAPELDGGHSMMWMDWNATGDWVVQTTMEIDIPGPKPLRFSIVLRQVEMQDGKLKTLQKIAREYSLENVEFYDDPFIRIPVRFLSPDSFVIASPLGWEIVEFTNTNGTIGMSNISWKKFPRYGGKPSVSFEGFWRNSRGKGLFAIRSGSFGEDAYVEILDRE